MRFESEEVNLKDIEKETLKLNTKKAVASNSIPAKVLNAWYLQPCASADMEWWNFKKSVDFKKILNKLSLLLFLKKKTKI